MTTKRKLDDAEAEGYRAHKAGKGSTESPYPFLSELEDAWIRGWCEFDPRIVRNPKGKRR